MTTKIQRLRFKNGTKIRFKYLQIKIKALQLMGIMVGWVGEEER
jgi:hypothetical protein